MSLTEKHINSEKSPLYVFENYTIVELPYYLYELSIYRAYKNRYECQGSKFLTSPKPLKFKPEIREKHDNYFEIKCVDFLGAPIEFIKENNLPIYECKKRKRKK